MAAPHGVAGVSNSIDICPSFGVNKEVKETKGSLTVLGLSVNPYGINIPLGGYGNLNSVSGNPIDDGREQGNLYIALGKNRFEKQKRRCILVGVEQSALECFGPSRGHYIDGMFIDLTEERLQLPPFEVENDDLYDLLLQLTWDNIELRMILKMGAENNFWALHYTKDGVYKESQSCKSLRGGRLL